MTRSRTSDRPDPVVPRRPGRPAGRTASHGVIADRESLLVAAERLIRERGPGVSLDAIAAEAGVTKPILYRGVGDREALVNALAQRLTVRMTEEVGKLVNEASDSRDAMHRLVGGYLKHAEADRHLYLYVTLNGAADDRVRKSLILADGTAAQFAAGIAAYRTSQGADPSVATTWAYGLVGALHFVTLWWLRDQSIDVEQVTDHITSLMWSGFSPNA